MPCLRHIHALKNMFYRKFRDGHLTRIQILIVAVLVLVCISILLMIHAESLNLIRHDPPEPSIICHKGPLGNLSSSSGPKDHTSIAGVRLDKKVLLIVQTQYSKDGTAIAHLLESNRMRYRVEPSGKSLPYLTHNDKGRYGVIIFENFEDYLRMDSWNRQLIDKYCTEYNVGIVSFLPSKNDSPNVSTVEGFPIRVRHNVKLQDYELNPYSPIWRLTRPTEVVEGPLPDDDWTVFFSNDTSYKPLTHSREMGQTDIDNTSRDTMLVPILQDIGLYDGIQRILFGNHFNFWLHTLVFLDSLSYLSHGKLSIPLERYFLIDVDDIFVGKTGTRMKVEDVDALVDAQERLQAQVNGFRFNLGYSGKYFEHGSPEESAGDRRILEYKDLFWWFGHMWRHEQPHKFPLAHLQDVMELNKKFAQKHGIPVNNHYAVAPHHSGVYPVHEPLYEAWKNVWDIKVTSSEEYPRLYPPRLRRGFTYKGITVLPRQTCGLFTHTIFMAKYQGGQERLDKSIRGGELFQAFLFNPINIFMTHLSNYGNDRLALYTFESVVKFIQCWTNLQLETVPPLALARKYMAMYPEEKDPVWQNPCADKRHLEIWSANKTCSRLPQFLVIGPQKTGTTALYTFLAMHPAVLSNYKSPDTFEEVQFFNGKNYFRGLDWYMNFFPVAINRSSPYLFEKSATYFDNAHVPQRVAALLPKAKLICILLSPNKRSYSWYQHMRAHKDPTALQYSFYEIISANDSAPLQLRELRDRCLNPGMYAQHIERWLTYFPQRQLMIMDGEMLKHDPIEVMNKVQHFLHIEPWFNYNQQLRYDNKKGFFCQIIGNRNKCLGSSKGRDFPPMDVNAEQFLKNFYRRHNVELSKLLTRLSFMIPEWLQLDLRNFE